MNNGDHLRSPLIIYSFTPLLFQLARAPPARCKGCRNEVTKSLLKNQWTKFSLLQPSFYSLILVPQKLHLPRKLYVKKEKQVSDRGRYLV